MIEFSLRDIHHRANTDFNGDLHAYIKERKRHIKGIASSAEDWTVVHKHAAQWYILHLHLVADNGFDELARDISRFKGETDAIEGETTTDSLERLLRRLPKPRASSARTTFEYALLQYYRHARNRIVHPGRQTKVDNLHKGIREQHQQTIAKDYIGFDAPNDLKRLSFDDFRIFSRALLRFAYWLNDAFALSAEEITRDILGSDIEKTKWMRHKGKGPAHLQQVISRAVAARFEMRDSTLSDRVAREVAEAVMATDNRKTRRRQRLAREDE